jgi:hypothetical protein
MTDTFGNVVKRNEFTFGHYNIPENKCNIGASAIMKFKDVFNEYFVIKYAFTQDYHRNGIHLGLTYAETQQLKKCKKKYDFYTPFSLQKRTRSILLHKNKIIHKESGTSISLLIDNDELILYGQKINNNEYLNNLYIKKINKNNQLIWNTYDTSILSIIKIEIRGDYYLTLTSDYNMDYITLIKRSNGHVIDNKKINFYNGKERGIEVKRKYFIKNYILYDESNSWHRLHIIYYNPEIKIKYEFTLENTRERCFTFSSLNDKLYIIRMQSYNRKYIDIYNKNNHERKTYSRSHSHNQLSIGYWRHRQSYHLSEKYIFANMLIDDGGEKLFMYNKQLNEYKIYNSCNQHFIGIDDNNNAIYYSNDEDNVMNEYSVSIYIYSIPNCNLIVSKKIISQYDKKIPYITYTIYNKIIEIRTSWDSETTLIKYSSMLFNLSYTQFSPSPSPTPSPMRSIVNSPSPTENIVIVIPPSPSPNHIINSPSPMWSIVNSPSPTENIVNSPSPTDNMVIVIPPSPSPNHINYDNIIIIVIVIIGIVMVGLLLKWVKWYCSKKNISKDEMNIDNWEFNDTGDDIPIAVEVTPIAVTPIAIVVTI